MSIWGDPVLPGGSSGGGGGAVLYGTTEPSAGLGNDGDLYIRTIPWSVNGLVDSGMGCAVRADCYCDEADTYLGKLYSRTYYKTNSGACIAFCLQTNHADLFESVPYSTPCLISTSLAATVMKPSSSSDPLEPNRSFTYQGQTWYLNGRHGLPNDYDMKNDSGMLAAQLLKKIRVPAAISDWDDAGAYIMAALGAVPPVPQTIVYQKSGGAWSTLPGGA